MPQREATDRSWQVSSATLRTPARALALLLVIFATAEIASRSSVIQGVLHAPSFGSPSRLFEFQLDGLERFAAVDARIDCIVLGNSTALMGVDPSALSRGYRGQTGEDLRCFNFGVAGMTATAAEAVAPILLARYRPALLVYVATARDLGATVDGPLLANSAWVQYRNGRFSLDGWLIEHSAAYRYFLLYRQWLDPSRWPAARSASGLTSDGYSPSDARLSLSAALWAHTQKAYGEVAGQPPSAAEMVAFDRLLALAAVETQVVVVEAPVNEKLRRWALREGEFYAAATTHMRQATRRQHVPFWRVPTWRVVPDDGWTDFVHLNRRGAEQFGEWLGARIGAAVKNGRIAQPRGRAVRA